MHHERSKHADFQYHCVRERVEENEIIAGRPQLYSYYRYDG